MTIPYTQRIYIEYLGFIVVYLDKEPVRFDNIFRDVLDIAGSKLRNPKPTQNNMRKHNARRSGTKTSGIFAKLNKVNTSGDQTIYTDDLIKSILKTKT